MVLSQGLQKPLSDQMEILFSLGEPQACPEARAASLFLPWPPGLPFEWHIWLLPHNWCAVLVLCVAWLLRVIFYVSLCFVAALPQLYDFFLVYVCGMYP